MFLAIIGAEAGAMALRCLARGGVFIAGGIVPRLLDRVTKTGALRDAFINRTARERFQYLLRSMPLYVVTNTKVGIIGSRYVYCTLSWPIKLTGADVADQARRSAQTVLRIWCILQACSNSTPPRCRLPAVHAPKHQLQPCHA